MYLYKMIVLLVIQLLVRAPATPVSTNDSVSDEKNSNATIVTEDYEQTLIDTIIDYYKHIDTKDLLPTYPIDTTNTNYKCGKLIYQFHIRSLEDNLSIILKKMFNYYLEKLDIVNKKEIVDLFKSDYVETICTHIPRCLDFIYICTPRFDRMTKILALHSNLCSLRKYFLTGNLYLDKPIDMELSKIENELITSFYKPFSEKTPKFIHTNLKAADDVLFVKKIFKIVNEIDKKNMVKNSDWGNKSILYYYYDLDDPSIKLPQPSFTYNGINDTAIQTLNQGLKKIIDEEAQAILFNNDYSEVTKLSNLVFIVVQGIEYYFWNGVLNDYQKYIDNNKDHYIGINQIQIKSMLSIDMLEGFCKYVPLILYYLSSNSIINHNLFSSYLTLCSDWIYFLTVRCETNKSKNGEMLYNLQCVKQSVDDKLMLNHFMTTDKIKRDYSFKNGIPEKNLLQSIIQSIHLKLNTFYMSKDNIYVWPTFNWLSGTHFFTKSFCSIEMNKIKEYITIQDDDYMSTLEVYNQLLPWNLNVRTIVGLNMLLELSIIDSILKFTWRQVLIINAYIRNTKVGDIIDEIFQRVNRSTKVYSFGILKLPLFMYSTDQEYDVTGIINKLINAINELNSENVYSFSNYVNGLIPVDYETQWNKAIILSADIKKSNLALRLGKIFSDNCSDALDFINTYILVMNKSKLVIRNMATLNVQQYCYNDGLDDVFVSNCKSENITHIDHVNENHDLSAEYEKHF